MLNLIVLQVLVLDEADRILDLGFKQAMNSIIENLPSERQTLLFSATQTKYVMSLSVVNHTHLKFKKKLLLNVTYFKFQICSGFS